MNNSVAHDELASSHTFSETIKVFFSFFATFAVTFFVIYFPIIVFTVFMGDDYNYYFHYIKTIDKYPGLFNLDTHHWLSDVNFLIGRPLANALTCFTERAAMDISNYPVIRSISVILAALISSIFAFRLYYRFNVKKWLAFLTSFIIFTLPGFMFYVIYYSFSLSWLVAVILTIAGVEFIERVDIADFKKARILRPKNIIFFTLSFIAVFLSLLIYCPATLFFLPYTATLLVFSKKDDWHKTRLSIIRNLVIFIFTIAVYFIFYKFLLLPFVEAHRQNSAKVINTVMTQYKFSLTSDIAAKVRLFKDISVMGLSLWNMFSNVTIAFSVIAIILGGFFANLIRNIINALKNKTALLPGLIFHIQVFAFALLFCLLANAPNLAASGGVVASRQLFPYTALIVIFLVAALIQISLLFKKSLGFVVLALAMITLALTAGFLNYDRVLRWITVNSVLENRFIQYNLAKYIKDGAINTDTTDVNYIHVVMPPWGVSFLGLPFGIADEIYSASARIDKIPGLIHFNLMQMGIDPNRVEILNEGIGEGSSNGNKIRLYVSSGTSYDLGDNSNKVVINMNDLLRQKVELGSENNKEKLLAHPYVLKLSNGETIKILESSSSLGHYGHRAFDSSSGPDDFWEAGGYPQWVELEYSAQKKFIKYEVQSGYTATDRMPKEWKLQGSNDRVNWKDLDERKDEASWNANETKTYIIAAPFAYRYYRFCFIAGNNGAALRVCKIKMVE